jgi:hypothetical protein
VGRGLEGADDEPARRREGHAHPARQARHELALHAEGRCLSRRRPRVRAYEKAWGKKLLPIGVGGSIPFVALFGRRFGDRPLILNGVMDPETGAHGPDESMHVGVFEKAIAANVYLYDELGALKY